MAVRDMEQLCHATCSCPTSFPFAGAASIYSPQMKGPFSKPRAWPTVSFSQIAGLVWGILSRLCSLASAPLSLNCSCFLVRPFQVWIYTGTSRERLCMRLLSGKKALEELCADASVVLVAPWLQLMWAGTFCLHAQLLGALQLCWSELRTVAAI